MLPVALAFKGWANWGRRAVEWPLGAVIWHVLCLACLAPLLSGLLCGNADSLCMFIT